MKIGTTLLFKQNIKNKVKGFLKSIIIEETKKNELLEKVENRGQEIASFYEYEYLGINDLFSVTGDLKPHVILGRSTFYYLDNIEKAKTLLKKEKILLDKDDELKAFNCSLVFFCKNIYGENYTISVLSMIQSYYKYAYADAEKLGLKSDFQNQIKSNSIKDIDELKFIGVEDICYIDLKFNVFQTFEADFSNDKEFAKELLTYDDIEIIIKDILAS